MSRGSSSTQRPRRNFRLAVNNPLSQEGSSSLILKGLMNSGLDVKISVFLWETLQLKCKEGSSEVLTQA